jgi:hypothetical protein
MVARLERGNNPLPTIGCMTRHAASTLLFLGVSLLQACTTIDMHEPIEGWPELTVYEHYVPHHVMRDRCVKYTAWGSSPEACAEFNLAERRCDLWFSADFPPPKAFIQHERLHCKGYDHVGETNMRDYLARYLAAQREIMARSPQEPLVR